MANDACIGLKKIHKDSIYDYDKSKNNTFIFMVNKLPLRNFLYDIR